MLIFNNFSILPFIVKGWPPHRTFVHSKEQLELTKVIKINAKECNNFHPISVFIHSAVNYVNRRQTLRNTWVSDLKRLNISVYFALGLTNNHTIQQIIQTESQLYGDLIQFNFIDNYYNNTLKGISILRWISKFCRKSQYILKTDDDVMVNINEILNNLDNFNTGLSGSLFVGSGVERSTYQRWYMPAQYYPKTTYPPYLNGPAYIMTNDITDKLLRTIDEYKGFILDIDDMFITGIMAESAGIVRYDSDAVHAYSCNDVCVMYSTAITYECKTNEELINFYTEWKSNEITPDYCQTKQMYKLLLFFTAITLSSISLTLILNMYLKRMAKYKNISYYNNIHYKQLI